MHWPIYSFGGIGDRVRFTGVVGPPTSREVDSALQDLIQSWRSRRWCTRRQLESLIGHLHHAAKVVWSGHTFLRHMIDLLCCFRSQDHPIRLNAEFQLDIQWWHDFLASWHGVSFWLFPGMSPPSDVEVTSDADGAWVPSQAHQSIQLIFQEIKRSIKNVY